VGQPKISNVPKFGNQTTHLTFDFFPPYPQRRHKSPTQASDSKNAVYGDIMKGFEKFKQNLLNLLQSISIVKSV
jgi:hypothetical protein